MEQVQGLNLTFYCTYNYSNDSIELLEEYNLARSITSIVGFFMIMAILLLTIFYRSYGSILQRLFIYLIVSIMAYQAASATDIQLQPRVFLGANFCKWTGYSKTSTFVVTLVFSCQISIYLLCIMYHQLHHKRLPKLSKSQKAMLELGLVLSATVIPLLLFIIPSKNFGLYGVSCWVKSYEEESCEPQRSATVLQWVIFSLYTVMHIFNVIAYIILVGIFLWLAFKSQRGRMQYLATARRTILLVLMLIVCTAVHLISILLNIALVYNKINDQRSIFLLYIINPVVQFTRPIAYMFYLNSVKKFHWESTRSSASRWRSSGILCCRRVQKWLEGALLIKTTSKHINALDHHQPDHFTPILTSSRAMYGTQAGSSMV